MRFSMRGWFAGLSLLLVVAAAACGGDDDDGTTATDAAPDALVSICGFPGDQGNSLGIGKFCLNLSDCRDTPSAPLCSIVGDRTTHFCTRTCSVDAGPEQCGEDVSCQCGDGGCGCTPNSCL